MTATVWPVPVKAVILPRLRQARQAVGAGERLLDVAQQLIKVALEVAIEPEVGRLRPIVLRHRCAVHLERRLRERVALNSAAEQPAQRIGREHLPVFERLDRRFRAISGDVNLRNPCDAHPCS